jgi:predicted metal-dependent enzyme (double-stranded beta helix superfamily)
MSRSALPSPLKLFLSQLDDVRSSVVLDMNEIGRLLVELASAEDYFAPIIAELPSQSLSEHWLVMPDRGPRLVLLHRPEGMMAYTHSHHCWVGVAPVRGVETHQHWEAVRHDDGRAELALAEDRALQPGEVATLVPPKDVHNHGHVVGTGPSPYSLVLLGDDMLLFGREEYDVEHGTWRPLAPGDPGRANR